MTELNEVEVLLVEDNRHDAEMTLDALKKHHLANRVHHVRDGAEALAFIFGTGIYSARKVECSPKLVLLDLKLPKVDGFEVLKKMKSDERTQMTPVVVLTSSNEERDVVASYRLGVNSYIVKPVDFEKFADSMRQLGLYWLLVNRSPR
jgi:two-component system response regulator